MRIKGEPRRKRPMIRHYDIQLNPTLLRFKERLLCVDPEVREAALAELRGELIHSGATPEDLAPSNGEAFSMEHWLCALIAASDESGHVTDRNRMFAEAMLTDPEAVLQLLQETK